eukprot:258807-Alexandrium_andersonii.AAC.1
MGRPQSALPDEPREEAWRASRRARRVVAFQSGGSAPAREALTDAAWATRARAATPRAAPGTTCAGACRTSRGASP